MKNIITIIAISLLSVGCASLSECGFYSCPTGKLPIELDYARHIKVDTDNNSLITRNELLDTCVKIFNYDRLRYKTRYHKSTEAVFRPEVSNISNGYEVFTNVRYFDSEDHNYRKIRCKLTKLSNTNDYLFITEYATGYGGGLVKQYIPTQIPGTLYHKSIE